MEMHILAYIYRWDRNTVRTIPILERKMWVDMIYKQKESEEEQSKKASKTK